MSNSLQSAPSTSLGIWLVRAESEALAARLQGQLGGTLYRPWLNAGIPQKQQFRASYRSQGQWIMLAASGVAVRFLEGLPQDKLTDPAVVLLDEAGRFAVSLLGGHEGGGNRLAYRVANVVGAVPVVTTATEALKPLVLGIGCRKNVPVEKIAAAVAHALALIGRTLSEVREVATIDLKAEEPGLLSFCAANELPMRVIAASDVAARGWVTAPSEWVQKNVGVDGVCEPCALIASPRGVLALPKTALEGVTVAIVEDIGLPDVESQADPK
ncbi:MULTISPECIES: cobalamin biosynthesis protein [unclassified Herbaspirillum]|uniref:cobalamin biosynthesis protein n=1 Tax=unclassified Herbaspirillum TaxID=2624150 RepID=UPI000E2FC5E1|nr:MULTISPECIES: cobalamin biosynthesis protein [unclassified Herbaspirillum]RFB73281.1 cobalamin biosynthesis protein CbiG [Herbaspirillum sp. 3R-3a1]TFI10910.1 cobalamin biosynthesis protein CbiG [Herbaspirillum sp. 3R11]TFI16818.1 cobalamin biosynthesis protein CbiG [Herbaspirillum sp. 3R-11]TFI26401.1 cobalamin biosynthesis protein CbiG [Herbaspirillum sp. 3C11]TFI26430.1 cobalamin biosynthesis protein CbiG [Herbaspirillum sp. 3C11]